MPRLEEDTSKVDSSPIFPTTRLQIFRNRKDTGKRTGLKNIYFLQNVFPPNALKAWIWMLYFVYYPIKFKI
ncbi:hypothetical protein CDAR_593181 [Caerostris darwini]|uniref:Uncharacterized protein n=1 Tax=Caerostris darwini TaxID=1538125 RepID=A0AAV4TZK0_9ARAC|nr:hypothetical protein CDAR_593181 [Caerostris darwini]